MAPVGGGAARRSPQPHGGPTHGEGSDPRGVHPLGRGAGGTTHTHTHTHPRSPTTKCSKMAPEGGVFIFLPSLRTVSPSQLSVGVGPGFRKPVVSQRDFHGCLENLRYDGLHLIRLAKDKDPQVAVRVRRAQRGTPRSIEPKRRTQERRARLRWRPCFIVFDVTCGFAFFFLLDASSSCRSRFTGRLLVLFVPCRVSCLLCLIFVRSRQTGFKLTGRLQVIGRRGSRRRWTQ